MKSLPCPTPCICGPEDRGGISVEERDPVGHFGLGGAGDLWEESSWGTCHAGGRDTVGQWLPGFSLSQAVWGSRSEGEICASFVPLVAFNHLVSSLLVEFSFVLA